MTNSLAKKISILLIAFFISGCAIKQQGTPYYPGTDATIEKLISEQEYQKALEILHNFKDKHSNQYTSRKKQLALLVSKFEKGTISKTSMLVQQGEFHSALETLEKALKKVPKSKDLNDLHDKLIVHRDRKLEETRINLLITEANYYLGLLKWYSAEARLKKPSLITQWQITNIEGSLDHLHKKLLECRETQHKTGSRELAEQCFQAAHKIKPDKPITGTTISVTVSEKTDNEPKELSKTKQSSPVKQDVTKTNTTLNNFLSAPPPTTGQTDSSKMKLIDQYMKEGENHYRAGRISAARDIWLKVLEIDKNHSAAQDQIERAEKILNRLDNLKEASQSEK